MRAGTKTVTRRLCEWDDLGPGDIVDAVDAANGGSLLYPIMIISNHKEPLCEITQDECEREGFPELTPCEFVEMFCRLTQCNPEILVNRIEFTRAFHAS